jgi:hypothetical protein
MWDGLDAVVDTRNPDTEGNWIPVTVILSQTLRFCVQTGNIWRTMKCNTVLLLKKLLTQFQHLRLSCRFCTGISWYVGCLPLRIWRQQYQTQISHTEARLLRRAGHTTETEWLLCDLLKNNVASSLVHVFLVVTLWPRVNKLNIQ